MLSQLALCSAPPLGAHLSLQPHDRYGWRRCRWKQLSTRSLPGTDAKTRSEDAARMRTGRELAPNSAAIRIRTFLQHAGTDRRPRAEDAGPAQERGGTAPRRTQAHPGAPRRSQALTGAHRAHPHAQSTRLEGGGTGCDNKQRQRPRAGLAAAGSAAATIMPTADISPRAGRRRLA